MKVMNNPLRVSEIAAWSGSIGVVVSGSPLSARTARTRLKMT